MSREDRLKKEILAIVLIGFLFLYGLSLFTYSSLDPSFNSSGLNTQVSNKVGIVGAYLAGLVFDLFGLGAFLFLILGVILLIILLKDINLKWYQWSSLSFLFLLILTWLSLPWFSFLTFRGVKGGGFIGNFVYLSSLKYLKFWGTFILLSVFTLLSIQILCKISWSVLIRQIISFFKISFFLKEKDYREKKKEVREDKEKKVSTQKQEKKALPTKDKPKSSQAQQSEFPPIDILEPIVKNKVKVSKDFLDRIALQVKECLNNFSIEGNIEKVVPGPVVSMVEYKPAPGIKISKIASLSDDLALALKASSVRIIAPLPGKDTVGIEIPNEQRETVFLKEVLDAPAFTTKKQTLPLALGKDIQGNPVVVDLAKMPHLLVAGATGAGKSVCLNSFLMSLVFAHSPFSLKLLLIDPKRIELSVYNDLPHLVHPVVTDAALAKLALDWAVVEMEKRYELMANLGVRNITSYNQKVVNFKKSDSKEDLEVLPYIVIVIDEMADLMLTGAKEVETSIVRLAQLARAAGIHLILATQRPSVDVVTGIIKANFPARIAFQVSSKHDSRTILDQNGAEYLLGKGDMLFKASGGSLKRVHGAFVSEEEIARVVDFWREKCPLNFELDLQKWKQEKEKNSQQESDESIVNDPKYQEAVEYAIEAGKVSISLIQRRLRIGFNKAALFVEQMERDGIIGPPEGSKPRQVLIKKH